MGKHREAKKNAERETAAFFGRDIDLSKDNLILQRFLDVAESGLDFMGRVANEDSGVETQEVNYAVQSITNCLSAMLAKGQKEFENGVLLDTRHPGIKEALEAARKAAQAKVGAAPA